MPNYICNFCKKKVEIENRGVILKIDNGFACPSCYAKLKSPDFTELKNILLRIEKKINKLIK